MLRFVNRKIDFCELIQKVYKKAIETKQYVDKLVKRRTYMNCAKSVKMIVILGCIVVNLVGCGMNDTTASSMSTAVSSQDTSSSSCNSEEKMICKIFPRR